VSLQPIFSSLYVIFISLRLYTSLSRQTTWLNVEWWR
jgi:hypothetical protein